SELPVSSAVRKGVAPLLFGGRHSSVSELRRREVSHGGRRAGEDHRLAPAVGPASRAPIGGKGLRVVGGRSPRPRAGLLGGARRFGGGRGCLRRGCAGRVPANQRRSEGRRICDKGGSPGSRENRWRAGTGRQGTEGSAPSL